MSATPRKPAPINSNAVPKTRNNEKPSSATKRHNDGSSDESEFGGSLGAASLMICFPLIMWYMWIGATYYDGKLPMPDSYRSWTAFAGHLAQVVVEGAYPTRKA